MRELQLNKRQSDQDILEKAAELRAASIPFALATVVRTDSFTSAKAGSKAIIEADGKIQGWIGGGCSQPAVIETAKAVLKLNKPRLIRISADKSQVIENNVIPFISSCQSGGALDIFVEPVVPASRLLILGSTPIAQHLCALAEQFGFSVFVACAESDSDLFPAAKETFSGFRYDNLSSLNPNYVIVATQGKGDLSALQLSLKLECNYIAYVASKRKAANHKARLRDKGYSAARVDEILAPAGIQICASGPAEIALSILAGLIATRGESSSSASSKLTQEKNPKPESIAEEAAMHSSSCCSHDAE